MPPALYLASACIKSFIWVIILILNLIALSALAIILTAILAYVLSITSLPPPLSTSNFRHDYSKIKKGQEDKQPNLLTHVYSITSITQLVYGAILVHRKRRGTLRGGNYAPAANPAMAVETGYGGAYVDPAADRYYQAPDPVSAPEYKSQSAYSAFPAPAPAPAPAYSTAPAQNYGQTQSGSYELDNRVHG